LKAFADAVRDSFQRELFSTDQPVRVMRPVKGTPLVMTERADGQIVLLNLQTDQPIDGVEANAIGVAAASGTQQWTSWTSDGKTVLLRDENTKQSVSAGGHAEPVRFAVFSPDGRYTITCSRDNTARLWRTDGELVGVLAGHSGNIYHADFSPNGELLFTRSTDGRVVIWNTDGRLVGRAGSDQDYFYDASFLKKGDCLATLSAEGKVDLWQNNGTHFNRLETSHPVRSMQADNDGKVLSLLDQNGWLYAFSVPEGRLMATFKSEKPIVGYHSLENTGQVLVWDGANNLSIWDDLGHLQTQWKAHEKRIVLVDCNPEGNLFLSTGTEGVARLWDAAGKLQLELPVYAQQPVAARFTPSGKHIVFAAEGNKQLSIIPIPSEILREMNALATVNSQTIKTLVERHNLQFVDEILKMHN